MLANDKCNKEFLNNLPQIPNSVLIKPFLNKQLRRTFSKEEDARLLYLVDNFGKKSWSKIAEMMPFRSPRQCKERYEGYLSPSITHDQFTHEDDMIILEKYNELGPKWTQISKFLVGRSGNQIKNRYNTYIKCQKNDKNKDVIKTNEKDNKSISETKKSDDELCCFIDFDNFQSDEFTDDDILQDDIFSNDDIFQNDIFYNFVA